MKLGPNEDIICLASGHSMIMGNMPHKLDLHRVGEKIMRDAAENKLEFERFGLFDSSQPNYTTYYPDVTAEDLNPTEDEFIYPVFRMLSMTTVHKQWNPISFAKEGVLKKAMSMLIGQTVNVDHETAVGNAIGVVQSVEWQEEYKDKSGVTIPAGINAVLKIDAKANPRLARGIMMSPPSIHSNSVTIQFKWEKSHSDLEDDEFWSKLGTYDKDGKLIQRVANEIVSFSETSLVAHGADPYAKKIENGKIVLAKHAHDRASLSETQLEKQENRFIELSYQRLGQIDTISNSDRQTIPTEENNTNFKNQTNSKMKDYLEKLAEATGFEFEGELNQEALMAHVTSLSSQVTELTQRNESLDSNVTELKGQLETLNTEKEELTSKVQELKPMAELGESHLTSTKAEAVRLYSLAKADKADETIIELIQNSDIKAATAFLNQYAEEVESDHEASCQDCGSKNVSRASQSLGDNQGMSDDDGGGNTNTKTRKEIKASLKDKLGNSKILKNN